MRIPHTFLVHTVTVTPLTGTGAYGDVFGTPLELKCFASGARRMIRDSTGTETLSSLTLVAAPGTAVFVPEGSQVLWRGDTTRVIATFEHDDGNLGAPQHTEVACE